MSGKQGLAAITRQLTAILERIHPNDYQQPLEIFNGSSIGQHFRHILDFYQCLIRGTESGIVDYSRRERDPNIEADPHYAAISFAGAIRYISEMNEMAPVAVRADFLNLDEQDRPVFPSSYGRELTFIHDHAIHHMAMIKIGIQAQCSYVLQETSFGIAPSTLRFQEEQGSK